MQEPVHGEFRDPDRVEDGKIGRLPVRNRVGQRLVQRREGNRDQVDLDVVGGGVADQLSPRAFRDDDAHLRLVGAAAQPVRVDERPAAPMAQDDPFLGELRERAGHGCSADPILLAELVLGGEPVAGAVPTAENLLEEERLQLVVERDRLLGIDRHLGPLRRG